MGTNFGENHPLAAGLMKGGLTGLGQGLQQQQNPNSQFNFQPLQQGFQNFRAQRKKNPLSTNGNNAFPQGPNMSSLYGDDGQ